MFEYLSDYIEQGLKLVLGDELKQLINSIGALKNIPKGTNLVSEGDMINSLYYIYKGIVRGYYIDSDGNDITKCFSSETDFVCAEKLLKEGEATYNVECLEDSICIEIPYSVILRGIEADDEMRAFSNKFTKKQVIILDERQRGLLMKTAMDRYLDFKRDYSAIENRISQEHIASYIGVRASSLSRLKRKMKTE